jgi:hypothetical protein
MELQINCTKKSLKAKVWSRTSVALQSVTKYVAVSLINLVTPEPEVAFHQNLMQKSKETLLKGKLGQYS